MYLVWSERTETGLRVVLMISKDQGVHWSEPIAISDQSSLREGDQGSSRYAFLPAIAVNRAGIVAVSWYEATLRERKLTWNLLLRASLDGGSTWLPGVRVSDVASSAPEDTWVGDTAGLAADIAASVSPSLDRQQNRSEAGLHGCCAYQIALRGAKEIGVRSLRT